MRRTNSPRDIFIRYPHYFQLNLDETCFLCNEGELEIVGDNDKPCHDKNCSDSRFYITVLRVESAAGDPYLVTKLLPLILGCTFVPFARNITGPFIPAALPTRRTLMENTKSLQFLSWQGLSLSPIIFNSPSVQRKQGSSQFN